MRGVARFTYPMASLGVGAIAGYMSDSVGAFVLEKLGKADADQNLKIAAGTLATILAGSPVVAFTLRSKWAFIIGVVIGAIVKLAGGVDKLIEKIKGLFGQQTQQPLA